MFSFVRRALVSSVALIAFASPGAAAPAQSIPFAVLDDNIYFIKNYVPIKKRADFVIEDYATFDSIFGVGMHMGAPKPQIAPKTFDASVLLVAATSGPPCELAAKALTAKGKSLTLRFTTKCASTSTSTQNDFVVVIVPKRPLTSVSFVENGGAAVVVKAPTKPIAAPSTSSR